MLAAEKGVYFLKDVEIIIYLYLEGEGFISCLDSESVKNCKSP